MTVEAPTRKPTIGEMLLVKNQEAGILREAEKLQGEFWERVGNFRSQPAGGQGIPGTHILSNTYENTVGQTDVWLKAMEVIDDSVGEKVLLDLGAGSAPVLSAFKKINHFPGLYVAVDYTPIANQWAEKRITAFGLDTSALIVPGDIRDPKTYEEIRRQIQRKAGQSQVDAVTSCFGIVNYAPDTIEAIARQARNIAKPGAPFSILMMEGEIQPLDIAKSYLGQAARLLMEKPTTGLQFIRSMPGTARFGMRFKKIFPPYTSEEIAETIENVGFEFVGRQPALNENASVLLFRNPT